MKISQILENFGNVQTDSDMAKFHSWLISILKQTDLNVMDPLDVDFQAPGYYSFELSKLISQHYGANVIFKIQDGALTVAVRTNHFKDGYGLNSKDWETPELFDELFVPNDDDELDIIATRALTMAKDDHRTILHSIAGVPLTPAREFVEQVWSHEGRTSVI